MPTVWLIDGASVMVMRFIGLAPVMGSERRLTDAAC